MSRRLAVATLATLRRAAGKVFAAADSWADLDEYMRGELQRVAIEQHILIAGAMAHLDQNYPGRATHARAAYCIGCLCTDHLACRPDRCRWVEVSRALGVGVCSKCTWALPHFTSHMSGMAIQAADLIERQRMDDRLGRHG